jgi:hypothetical protein
MTLAADALARVILAFEPYNAELVYVGGWVHALYLAGAGSSAHPVMTDDVDVSLPLVLAAVGRPTLRELARQAGFVPNWLSMFEGEAEQFVYEVSHPLSGTRVVDLDLLAESPVPRTAVPIAGQPDLIAQGYPGQRLLQENVQWMEVGPPLLDPARRIRVPTLGAYVLHKGVASTTRAIPAKAIKDLVYVYEIVRDPVLSRLAVDGVRSLAFPYPEEYAIWRARFLGVVRERVVRRAVAEQIVVASGAFGTAAVVEAQITARFERMLGETEIP